LQEYLNLLPAVHKLATGGYDGRGVQLLVSPEDVEKGFDTPSLLEKMVTIKHEIAVMVAMNANGDTAVYPAAEMMFDATLNQLDFQLCPAMISEQVEAKAEALALQVVKALGSPGIFAVEMFVNENDDVFVNETAPRVHNSGHHTIEANYSSQFDMLWRVLLDYPLGNTATIQPSALVNVVGEKGHVGLAKYEGLNQVLQMGNAFVHIYGKAETKPGRKMGHVTLLDQSRDALLERAHEVKQLIKVCS